MLADIAPLIAKLVSGADLTTFETKSILEVTSKEDHEGYYYLAFVAAIMAKGLTEDELLGLVEGLQSFSITIDVRDPDTVTDVSGSGGDSVKTFNVSTLAALTTAACGIKVAKQSFRAFTSFTGSSDILVRLGVSMPGTAKTMASVLDRVGISPINYPYVYQGMEARLKVVDKLRMIGLQFPTPLHPIALVPSPVRMKRRTYGLFTDKYLLPVAHIFQRLGYQRGLVFHGVDGLDEISSVGPTKVVEFDETNVHEYVVTPQDMGIVPGSIEDITVASADHAIRVFLQVAYGLDHGTKTDLVAANAGASLWVMDKAISLRDGVAMAKVALQEGLVGEKLDELVEVTGGDEGVRALQTWKGAVGI
jgi:anthranilate phosphoribosyltransferase